MAKLTLSAEAAKISGMSFVTVYVDDFTKALEFYQDILALEKTHQADVDACFFSIGANEYGLFLAGGARAKTTKAEDAHASFVLLVESASALFQRLRMNGVKTVQDEPMDRGEGDFWFQFYDPANNLLEVLGGK
jgi:predicted enzyme related to lactoylglutathione lyase